MSLRWVAGAPLLSGRPSSITFLERLLSSEHRTADPDEADYFFMPMVGGRCLHSFTFQLNVSVFYGIGGALRGYLGGGVRGVRGCQGVFRVCL